MLFAMVVAVQSAEVAGPPVPADLRPAKLRVAARSCGEPDESGDIVVCARAKDTDRLPRIDPNRYVQAPPRAETELLGKARLSLEAEQGTLPNGQSSPRAMVRLKMPF
jgi:hypothetical protein